MAAEEQNNRRCDDGSVATKINEERKEENFHNNTARAMPY
jgi:hypothetical protein